jgi:hypothetical protein
MSMRFPHLLRHFCSVYLFLDLSAVCVMAQRQLDGPADNKQRADFERLAKVFSPPGTPSVKGKAWVAVDTGPANFSSDLRGWLIKDDLKEIILLDWYGELHKLRKPRPNEKRPKTQQENRGRFPVSKIQRADYSVAWKVRLKDFGGEAKRFLADGMPEDKEPRGISGMVQQRFGLEGHVIEAARFAHFAYQLGHKPQAIQLYAHARKAQMKYAETYIGESDKTCAIHVFVADSLASGHRNGAIYAGHDGTPRQELQKQWEKIAAIPYHQYREEAKAMAKHYQSLLKEDRRWVEPNAKALAKMTIEQKVAYWLYHLRDLDVGQWSDPGRCYVLGFGFSLQARGKAKPNAAVELKKLGMTAVPELIAHLDDARPTRCKGHWRSYWPDGHYLLRYGDCCQQIFESITGHTIASDNYPVQAGKGNECKKKAERWWQDYQKKGEKQMLIEGTAAGDRDSSDQASRLAKKYPDAAIAPIIQGARASKDPWVRASLVQTADQLKDRKVVAFLREELAGPFLDSRVKAAIALTARGEPVGARALVREWKNLRGKNADSSNQRWAIDDLVGALISSGDPAAVRLLGDEMPHHDVTTRSTIIGALGKVGRDLRNKPLTQDAVKVIEDVLVKAMEDLDEENSLSSRADKELRDPMLGDFAAEALTERWKQPKLFDITGPLQVRERQRLEVKNVWLQKRGKKPIPVPAPRRVRPAPEAKVQPLVKAVLDAKTAAVRQQALKAIEGLGLPALPAVRKLLGSLKKDHPAHAEVQSLAARLAFIVREARFGADSVKPNEVLRQQIAGLQGKPITKGSFMDLLQGTASALPDGVRGVKIALERIPDDSGVYLVVTLIADRPPRKGLSPQLTYGSYLRVGEKRFGGDNGVMAGIGKAVGLAEIDWTDFIKNLRSVLKAQADQYVLVRAHCVEMR